MKQLFGSLLKTSFLAIEGVKTRYQVTNTISDIYKEVSIVLGQDDIVLGQDNIYRNSINEQNILIKRALSEQRTLLIIDNFETIDDERVNSFVRELPHPTKCIVTTRYRIDIAEPIRLSAMPREDALSLIQEECKKKNLYLDDAQAELLYRRTAGVPLAVVWTIAQISYHGFNINKILRILGDAKGDISRFCFESAMQQIQEKPAYKLIVSISLSSNSLTREAIGYIADVSELDRDENLIVLEGLSLVNRKSSQYENTSYYSVLPLVREYVFSDKPNIKFNDLENIISRIAEKYAPSGAYAISLIDGFFDAQILAPLKAKVTSIVVETMWEWDNYYDEQGVYHCIEALEKLATDEATRNIKAVAHGNTSYQSGYIYLDAIRSLGRLRKLTDLIELILIDKNMGNSVIEVLKEFSISEVSSEIDKFLDAEKDKQKFTFLRNLKDKVEETDN